MEIFRLFGSILINDDEANKSLAKTDKNAKSVAGTLSSGIKTVGKWGAAIGTAVAGAAAGMAKMATSAAGTADNIDKMSQKIGISREAYQELDFALSQSGTDVDKLQTGMKTMSQQVEKNAKAFEDLGVALTDSDGKARSQEEIFYDTVRALQEMEEGTEKTVAATQLFGKTGTELMPLLNQEAGSLDKLRQEAHDLGLVMEDELVDGGVSLTDTLDKMKRSLGAVMTQLGARLMPIVEKAANFIIGNIPKITKLIDSISPIVETALDEILPVILNLSGEILPQFIDTVMAILPAISRIFSALAPVVSTLISKLAPVVNKLISKLLPPFIDILDAATPILDVILQLLDPILGLLDSLLDPLAELLKVIAPILSVALEIINSILKPIMPLIQGLAEMLGNVLGGAVESVAGYFSGWVEVLRGVMEFLSGDFESGIQHAADGMITMFSNALGAIDTLFGTNFKKWYDETVTFFEGVGRDLYNALHPDAGEAQWSYEDALARTASFLQPVEDTPTTSNFDAGSYYANHYKTPKLAAGGVVYGKTLAVVGDNENVRSDPEVVAPLSTLGSVTGSDEILSEIRETNALLRQLLTADTQPINMDGQRVATIITNKINKMRYTAGREVIFT